MFKKIIARIPASLLLSVTFALLLTACGIRGPLTLPTIPPTPTAPHSPPPANYITAISDVCVDIDL
ncbi:MAG: hypothetical protein IT497_05930 [Ottowia sp.]|nr:hypothetical protein [Ottowia sp.]